jgi:hypothetical protein
MASRPPRSRVVVDVARTLTDKSTGLPGSNPGGLVFHWATVSAVDSATATITGLAGGSASIPNVPWLGSAPTSGSVVLVAVDGTGGLVIVGQRST